MAVELEGQVPMRSPNLYGDPKSVLEVYGYDPERHADECIASWLNGGEEERDALTKVGRTEADSIANWFLPEDLKYQVHPEDRSQKPLGMTS